MPDSQKSRQRVLRISGINAWSILIVAGIFALISLLLGDGLGFLVGAAVLVSPWMELKARKLFRENQAGARAWYLRSQVYLFSVIFVYSLSQIISFYHSGGVAALPVEVRQALYSLLLQDEKSLNALMREIYLIFYGSIVLTSLLYQGGLFLFYRRHVSPTAKS